MSLQEGTQLGNYRLTSLLGRGGFAEVYLAQHIRLDTLAAIKVLYTDAEGEEGKRFQREAKIVASLSHPHIVSILDFDIEDKLPFLVMEYAPGGPVHRTHRRDEILPVSRVLSYVEQIGAAIQYAHDQNIVHRDLKPENILIGTRKELLLSDFGIAKIMQNASSGSMHTFAGTTPYMAPEQIQGHPCPASDQYALGIIVYEWLCGTRPFNGSLWEVIAQHVSTSPPPLRQHNPAILPTIEDVVLRALSKQSNDRFSSVTDFVSALKDAAEETSVSATEPPANTTQQAASTQPKTAWDTPQSTTTPPGTAKQHNPPTIAAPVRLFLTEPEQEKQGVKSAKAAPKIILSGDNEHGPARHTAWDKAASPTRERMHNKNVASKIGALSCRNLSLFSIITSVSTIGGYIFYPRSGLLFGFVIGLCLSMLLSYAIAGWQNRR